MSGSVAKRAHGRNPSGCFYGLGVLNPRRWTGGDDCLWSRFSLVSRLSLASLVSLTLERTQLTLLIARQQGNNSVKRLVEEQTRRKWRKMAGTTNYPSGEGSKKNAGWFSPVPPVPREAKAKPLSREGAQGKAKPRTPGDSAIPSAPRGKSQYLILPPGILSRTGDNQLLNPWSLDLEHLPLPCTMYHEVRSTFRLRQTRHCGYTVAHLALPYFS